MKTHLFVPLVAVVLSALAGCTAEATSDSSVESTGSELKLTQRERETPEVKANGQAVKLTPTTREYPTITLGSPVRDNPDLADAYPNVVNRLRSQRERVAVEDPSLPAPGEIGGQPIVSNLDTRPLLVNPIPVKHAQPGTAWADDDRNPSLERP